MRLDVKRFFLANKGYNTDSSHPQHQTKLAYGWIAKGIRKGEKMTACQRRVNLIGAMQENPALRLKILTFAQHYRMMKNEIIENYFSG